MGKIYLAADMRLFDEAAAKEQNLSVDEYNNMIVEKINTFVEEGDYLLITGIFSKKNATQTAKIIKKMNGKKILLNREENKEFTELDFEWLGFTHIWNIDMRHKTSIRNQESAIIIIGSPDYLDKYKKIPDIYIAVAGSEINQEELYKDRVLNVSLAKWSFNPIEIETELTRLFDDQELFLTME